MTEKNNNSNSMSHDLLQIKNTVKKEKMIMKNISINH